VVTGGGEAQRRRGAESLAITPRHDEHWDGVVLYLGTSMDHLAWFLATGQSLYGYIHGQSWHDSLRFFITERQARIGEADIGEGRDMICELLYNVKLTLAFDGVFGVHMTA
jgi:hypothetical protein